MCLTMAVLPLWQSKRGMKSQKAVSEEMCLEVNVKDRQ